MWKGYHRRDAAAQILSRLYPEDYVTLPPEMLKPLIGQCIDAELDYMVSRDILRPDGSLGNCYYNRDNARRHILLVLIACQTMTEDRLFDYIRLVDDYLDYNRSYLELHGLRYPEDDGPEV